MTPKVLSDINCQVKEYHVMGSIAGGNTWTEVHFRSRAMIITDESTTFIESYRLRFSLGKSAHW